MANLANPSDESLQTLIHRAVQERKALLCLVADESDSSQQWKTLIDNVQQRSTFLLSTLGLELTAGSQEAGLLGAVCPIESTPVVIIIQNGQVVGNYPAGSVDFDQLQAEMAERFPIDTDEATDSKQPVSSQNSGSERLHIELPPSNGRMRLPNNAFDRLRELTDKAVANGVKSPLVFRLQLAALRSTKIPLLEAAAKTLNETAPAGTPLGLDDEVINKLLNTPASAMSTSGNSQESRSRSSQTSRSASNAARPSSAAQTPATSSDTSTTTPQSESQQTQRQSYIQSQLSRENAAKAERERIRAQIARDKAARKEAEVTATAEQRVTNLAELRKSNSTLPNPSSTDIRVQVRTFDGSTIRNTFPVTATVSGDVRPWIDRVQAEKDSANGAQPYNLKIVLAPLPNRLIEAGEEEQRLSDLDIQASCTMIMVPVKGFVESYTGVSGGTTGLIGSAVSGGYGLVSGAAGMLFGGVRSLIGGAAGAGDQQQQPAERSELPGDTPRTGGSGSAGNVKVRTLADQRVEDARKKGKDHQLYNGNQLNFEPRNDQDESKKD